MTASALTASVPAPRASIAERKPKRLSRRFVQCTIIDQLNCCGAADYFRAAQAKSPRQAVVGDQRLPKTLESRPQRRLCAAESAQTRFGARSAAGTKNTN
jgi:hypothetical protein